MEGGLTRSVVTWQVGGELSEDVSLSSGRKREMGSLSKQAREVLTEEQRQQERE